MTGEILANQERGGKKTDVLWENIGKELQESGEMIYCGKYSGLIQIE